MVNVFLSSFVWTRPLNAHGVRQHVAALYDEIFKDSDRRIFPTRPSRGLLRDVVEHLPLLLRGGLNVVSQDYPLVTAGLATFLKRDPALIVHTWKVPGVFEPRLAARINDWILRRAIQRARAVVVVSELQAIRIRELSPQIPVIVAPVSVDSSFWRPTLDEAHVVLSRLGLEARGFVLTVGGPDRDEIFAARVAKNLGVNYLRVTYDSATADNARRQLRGAGLDQCVVATDITDIELRALYSSALLVCLPTKTETNPAGLTSLTVGMACAAAVAVPQAIAHGYLKDEETGFVIQADANEFSKRVLELQARIPEIRKAARAFALRELNNGRVAAAVRDRFAMLKLM